MYQCQQCGCDYITSRLDFICSTKCSTCFNASKSQNRLSRGIKNYNFPQEIKIADSCIPLDITSNEILTDKQIESDFSASSSAVVTGNVEVFEGLIHTWDKTVGFEVFEADTCNRSLETETAADNGEAQITGENRVSQSTGKNRDTQLTGKNRENQATGNNRKTQTTGKNGEENRETQAIGEKRDIRTTRENRETQSTGENRETLSTGENRETLSTGENRETLSKGENRESQTIGENRETKTTTGDECERLDSEDSKYPVNYLEDFDRSDSTSPERDSSSDSDYEPTKFPSFYEGENKGKFKYCDSYLKEVAFEEIGLTTAGKKPYKCKPCKLIFFSKTQRKNHSVIHSEKGDILYSGVKVRILN